MRHMANGAHGAWGTWELSPVISAERSSAAGTGAHSATSCASGIVACSCAWRPSWRVLAASRQAASCIVRTNTVALHTGPAPVHWLTQLRLSFHPFSPCTPPRLTTTWSVATTSPMATWAAQAGPVKVKPARAAYRPHHRAPARRLPVPLVIAKYAKT